MDTTKEQAQAQIIENLNEIIKQKNDLIAVLAKALVASECQEQELIVTKLQLLHSYANNVINKN